MRVFLSYWDGMSLILRKRWPVKLTLAYLIAHAAIFLGQARAAGPKEAEFKPAQRGSLSPANTAAPGLNIAGTVNTAAGLGAGVSAPQLAASAVTGTTPDVGVAAQALGAQLQALRTQPAEALARLKASAAAPDTALHKILSQPSAISEKRESLIRLLGPEGFLALEATANHLNELAGRDSTVHALLASGGDATAAVQEFMNRFDGGAATQSAAAGPAVAASAQGPILRARGLAPSKTHVEPTYQVKDMPGLFEQIPLDARDTIKVFTDANPGWMMGSKAAHIGDPGVGPLPRGGRIIDDVRVSRIARLAITNVYRDHYIGNKITLAYLEVQVEVSAEERLDGADVFVYIPRKSDRRHAIDTGEPIQLFLRRHAAKPKARGEKSRLVTFSFPIVNGIYAKGAYTLKVQIAAEPRPPLLARILRPLGRRKSPLLEIEVEVDHESGLRIIKTPAGKTQE